jgi:DNA-damage-inducible protein D
MTTEIIPTNHIVVFNDQQIRRVMHNDEWFYSVIDIIGTLTDSKTPKRYWSDLKIKLTKEEGFQLYDFIVRLKLVAPDGKLRPTDCANTEGIFRIIQSIPSPKAEPFKRWLAQVGYERVKEIEDPELASQRARTIYKAKGYSDTWIEKRMRGIQIRDELTDEWKNRDVTESRDFGILTAEICKATFGVTPTDYKKIKALNKENLRDHMTDLELIFTMLGEASTTAIARTQDAQRFTENKGAAQRGGTIAGKARKALELETGEQVVTEENYLHLAMKEVKQLEEN